MSWGSVSPIQTALHKVCWGGNARTYTYRLADSKPNQIESIFAGGNLVATYQYDANGNVSGTDELPALRYDPYLNLTTRIERPSAGNVTFGYGMADERVYKQDYDSQGDLLRSIYYVHGLGSSPLVERKVDEQNSTTSTIYHIYGLNGMLATQASGQWHFMLKDHLGSTRVVTDENDLVAAYYNYSAFGESFMSAESEEFAYRFTGQEYDEETGLHNYKARLYDSELGRFYGVDPVPQYTSPYAYVGNSPVNYVDPDGQFFLPAWVAGAIIGGGLGYANAVINDYDSRQTGYSIVAGALLGVGVGLGIDAGIFDGIGRVAGNGLAGVDNGIGYAEGVFQGVKPFVDGGLNVVQGSITAGPITTPGQVVDDFGLGLSDYGSSYVPSPYRGLDPVKRGIYQTNDAFFNDPVTQGAIEVGSSLFPAGKVLGIAGKLIGRGVTKIGEKVVTRGGAKLLQQFNRFPNAAKKFGKHAKEFTSVSDVNVYYRRAISLADSKVGGHIKGFTSRQGWTFRFNSRTGEFLTTHPNGHIETFFRPKRGIDYYLKQVQLYGN